jgi:signal transduction histidine kinase
VSQPAPPSRRRLLGTAHTLSERVRVYWTGEALEVDRLDQYEIRRRRVFFDEVLLVTLHAGRTALPIVFPLLMAMLFGLLALVARAEASVSRGLLVVTAFFAAWTVTAAALPVWIVTVYGKRTRARMHFRLKQGKAREVYAEICRAASDAQRAV